jgi:chemotaxis protein histidine kinase CheA
LSQSNPFAAVKAPGASLDMVARAEAALKALAGQFARWMQDEIDKLDAARADIAFTGLAGEPGEALYRTAHDLKGLGGTYGFPIVSRIAGSLCHLLDDVDKRISLPLDLIDAHIQAIKTVVRDDMRDEQNPGGAALASALEDRVKTVVG